MSDSFVNPWTVVCQAPFSMEFSMQGYWSGLLFPSPGDLPNSGKKPMSSVSPTLQADSLPLSHLGSPLLLPKERLTNRVRREQNESDLKKLAFEMVLGFQWLTWEQGRQGAVNPGPGQAAPKSASLAY